MKRSTKLIALGVVLAVAGSLAQSAWAQTNETWGGQGGASSWHAGTAKTTWASTERVATGAESSWGAGKASVGTRGAPGGVWSDGTTSHATLVQAPGPKAAAGASALGKPVGLTSLGSVPSRSRIAATGAKGQTGPQFGLSKSSGMSHGISRGRAGATAGRGQLGTSSRSGTSRSGSTAPNPGLESPLQSDSAMKGLTGSTSSSTLGLEPHSSLDSSSH
jgi:hypothetical protein